MWYSSEECGWGAGGGGSDSGRLPWQQTQWKIPRRHRWNTRPHPNPAALMNNRIKHPHSAWRKRYYEFHRHPTRTHDQMRRKAAPSVNPSQSLFIWMSHKFCGGCCWCAAMSTSAVKLQPLGAEAQRSIITLGKQQETRQTWRFDFKTLQKLRVTSVSIWPRRRGKRRGGGRRRNVSPYNPPVQASMTDASKKRSFWPSLTMSCKPSDLQTQQVNTQHQKEILNQFTRLQSEWDQNKSLKLC